MGLGIAQIFAIHGYETILADIKTEVLELAKQKLDQTLKLFSK